MLVALRCGRPSRKIPSAIRIVPTQGRSKYQHTTVSETPLSKLALREVSDRVLFTVMSDRVSCLGGEYNVCLCFIGSDSYRNFETQETISIALWIFDPSLVSGEHYRQGSVLLSRGLFVLATYRETPGCSTPLYGLSALQLN